MNWLMILLSVPTSISRQTPLKLSPVNDISATSRNRRSPAPIISIESGYIGTVIDRWKFGQFLG